MIQCQDSLESGFRLTLGMNQGNRDFERCETERKRRTRSQRAVSKR